MALASNALSKTYGSTTNFIVDGAAISDGNLSTSETIDNAFSNTDGYAWCDVVLTIAGYGSAPSAGNAGISLYRRNLNIVSTNDEPAIDANYKQTFVGAKTVDAITGAQYIVFEDIPIPTEDGCEFVIENNAGQQLSANWDLDIKPWTWVPAS